MFAAMYPSISQIKSAQYGLRTIGSNLSLINTTAGRGSRVEYVEMGSQVIKGAQGPTTQFGGTNPVSIGFGSIMGSTDVDTSTGALNPTGISTDLAIDGHGFFVFSTGSGLVYSRDGALKVDSNGDLCHNATGYRVMGWPADSTGNINTTNAVTAASKINLPIGISGAAQATSSATLIGNLSSIAAPTDPSSVTLLVYDSLGNTNQIRIDFTGRINTPIDAVTGLPANGIPAAEVTAGATAKWSWNAVNLSTGLSVGSSATAGNTPLYFNNTGGVVSAAGTNHLGAGTITIPGLNGATATSVAVNFTAITQVSANSALKLQTQNGFGAGSLQDYSIGSNGVIVGQFSTGFPRNLGQLAVSTFSNEAGLQKVGNNMWESSDNSGAPLTGIASTDARGGIRTGFLERSNIDFGDQFTSIITEERGTQANTKMISTIDSLLGDIIQMKR